MSDDMECLLIMLAMAGLFFFFGWVSGDIFLRSSTKRLRRELKKAEIHEEAMRKIAEVDKGI